MPLDKIEALVDDLRRGKMVILMDDGDRENEGDLIMAANRCERKTLISWSPMLVVWFV